MEQKDVIKRLSDYIEYDALTNPSDFAKGANVDVSGFSKMLKGKQTITVNTLKKIANAYGINLKWLMAITSHTFLMAISSPPSNLGSIESPLTIIVQS